MFAIIIVICLLAVIGTALTSYLWSRPRVGKPDTELAPPKFAGLFPSEEPPAYDDSAAIEEASRIRAVLIDCARAGDTTTLLETQARTDATLYNELLDTLTALASESSERLRALVSYISNNGELRANKRLAELVISAWEAAPDRRSTIEMLHVAALSDDAAVYQAAVESVISLWQKGKLLDFRSQDLIELLESQFWMLAPRARQGGAGFALKQRLAGARRELATTTPANP